jgi:hypothetical protein
MHDKYKKSMMILGFDNHLKYQTIHNKIYPNYQLPLPIRISIII